MKILQIFFALLLVAGLSHCRPFPGKSHHDRVRIHIPTRIKTVYKTKFIKVPEHHHYFHEKIKEIPHYIPIPKDDHKSLLHHDDDGY